MQENQINLPRAAVVLATLTLLCTNAFAQEGEEKEKQKLPLQKGPLVNPRGLQIPGKLPQLQKGNPPPNLSKQTLEGLKKGAPPQPGEGEEPVKLTAPPPSDLETGPSFSNV